MRPQEKVSPVERTRQARPSRWPVADVGARQPLQRAFTVLAVRRKEHPLSDGNLREVYHNWRPRAIRLSCNHGLQMTPVARLRRAVRAICNRPGGRAAAGCAISRQCAATRRVAVGTVPGVSCGQPGHPLHFTAQGIPWRCTCGGLRRAGGRFPRALSHGGSDPPTSPASCSGTSPSSASAGDSRC